MPTDIGNLVVGRKNGQFLLIGKDILVGVDRAKAGRCQLIVKAPRDIPVVRVDQLPSRS